MKRYEDKRIPVPWEDVKTWQAEKPLTPWGTVPVLDYDGLVIGQSTAANRLTNTMTLTYVTTMIISASGSLPRSLDSLARTMLSRHRPTRWSTSSLIWSMSKYLYLFGICWHIDNVRLFQIRLHFGKDEAGKKKFEEKRVPAVLAKVVSLPMLPSKHSQNSCDFR